MQKIKKLFDTIDKRAFMATLLIVLYFLGYLYVYRDYDFMAKFRQLIGKSNKTATNSEMYCSKKGNQGTAFCSDRRAETNEKWRDVSMNSSGGRKSKSAFNLNR